MVSGNVGKLLIKMTIVYSIMSAIVTGIIMLICSQLGYIIDAPNTFFIFFASLIALDVITVKAKYSQIKKTKMKASEVEAIDKMTRICKEKYNKPLNQATDSELYEITMVAIENVYANEAINQASLVGTVVAVVETSTKIVGKYQNIDIPLWIKIGLEANKEVVHDAPFIFEGNVAPGQVTDQAYFDTEMSVVLPSGLRYRVLDETNVAFFGAHCGANVVMVNEQQ